MLSAEDGIRTVKFARNVVDSFVKKEDMKTDPTENFFDENLGVFVTLHTYPENQLRGCIGIPEPVMPLKKAINESGRSASRDPRFPPVSENELDNIIVEVTILTKPKKIQVDNPKEYIENIKIGQDGLVIEHGPNKGLLLPQVPIEQGWDVEEFLTQICWKAWLPPDAWMDENTSLYKFQGQIFTEVEPRGAIKEKKIDGSDS